MKKIYTLVFAQNNVNSNENYLLDLNSLGKDEDLIKKALAKVVYCPKQSVIDRILKFAKERK